jgi:hypothetical protein
MPDARVAILILLYNGRDLVDDCLAAVRRHTDLDGVTVAVIDNRSTDGGADHVEKAHPWVRLVRNEENLGFAGGVNRGIEAVPASAYVLLNTDALVTAGWLARLEATAAEDRRIGIVGAIEVTAPGLARFPEDAPLLADKAHPVVDLERVSFACALIRHAVVARIGLLDHGYFMYHEDWDYCHRAQLAGFRTVVDARVELVHPGRGSFNRQPGGWKVRVRTVSRQRYQLVHWPARRLWGSLGREALLFAYWTKEGHPLAYMQGCWTTLRTMPDIRRKRRAARGLAQRANE